MTLVPETFGTVLAFLGFVAPGLSFELLRERRRPSIEETAFREASRIALASLLLTLSALATLAIVSHFSSWLFADPREWFRRGNAYVHENFGLVGRSMLLHLAIAFSLCVLVDWLLRQSARGRIVPRSIRFQLFRQRCPDQATPWLHVKLDDETEIWGYPVTTPQTRTWRTGS